MKRILLLRHTVLFALLLGLCVVMLGAYTRLTDAGLGCPDWPGCYGRLVLPTQAKPLSEVQRVYPDNQLITQKAWTEMAHRYVAGVLACLILLIFIEAMLVWRSQRIWRGWIPVLLLGLVVFQALLGMWTVTLKLLPQVVMGHLLGGLSIFSCLCYYWWQLSNTQAVNISPAWRKWTILGLLILFLQIALGGWVSSNYAGVACVGFPQCNGMWWPHLQLQKAFNLFSPIGVNYQGGVLDIETRMTIQWVHRLGAVLTAMYLLFLSACLLRSGHQLVRYLAGLVVLLVVIQFSLGIVNVMYLLPLWASVAHNGVAALLLATMMSLLYFSNKGLVHATC